MAIQNKIHFKQDRFHRIAQWYPIYSKRLPAFSVLEMLVVMVLMGMVSATIYFVFESVSQYHTLLKKKTEQQEQVKQSFYILQSDFSKYPRIIVKGDGQIQFQNVHWITQVVYRMENKKVIRKQATRLDTLNVQFTGVRFFYDKLPVDSGVVNGICLRLVRPSDTLDLRITRQMDAASQIVYYKPDSALWK